MDDLFEDAERPPLYGVRAGRYRFPPPPGIEESSNGWMRMTNLVSSFSDQERLQLWLEAKTLLGLLANDGLIFDELAAVAEEDLSWELLAKFAEKARVAAGADAGARRGTARHLMLEGYLSTGTINGHRRMQLQMADLLKAMEEHELDFVPGDSEVTVFNEVAPGKGVIGTRDTRVMCRRTGQVGVLDLKTQARFWTYQEVCGQQEGYSSAQWDWSGPRDGSGCWVQARPNTLLGRPGGVAPGRRVALLAHMPSAGGPVEIHEVDLEYGRKVLQLAVQIVELRSIGKSVAQGRRVGGLRPAIARV